MSEALQWLQLLLIPTVGLLWRVSTQLATLQAVQGEHTRRLEILERRREQLS